MKILCSYSLRTQNTFGIEAKTAVYAEYDSLEELQLLINKGMLQPVLHVGQGSNLLFTQDYKGTVLHSRITDISVKAETSDEVLLKVGAGGVWDDLVAYCVEHQFYGLENLTLIPGEVGASAVQNIGAYGAEAQEAIYEVEVVDLVTGSSEVKTHESCHYAYRFSEFKSAWKGRYAVTYVVFKLSKTFVPNLNYAPLRAFAETVGTDHLTAKSIREEIARIRRDKLPDTQVLGNAGSFFMNPVISQKTFEALQQLYPQMPHYATPDGVKVPAGWLIEQCGWKGRRVGNVGIYEKQALVIVNYGGANGKEIMALSDRVCDDVFAKFGISIHPEVNWI